MLIFLLLFYYHLFGNLKWRNNIINLDLDTKLSDTYSWVIRFSIMVVIALFIYIWYDDTCPHFHLILLAFILFQLLGLRKNIISKSCCKISSGTWRHLSTHVRSFTICILCQVLSLFLLFLFVFWFQRLLVFLVSEREEGKCKNWNMLLNYVPSPFQIRYFMVVNLWINLGLCLQSCCMLLQTFSGKSPIHSPSALWVLIRGSR